MTAIFALPRVQPLAGDLVLSSGQVAPRVLPGAKLEFYQANTTTQLDVYVNAARSTKHSWPVVADSTGKFPAIYLPAGVTLDAVLKTSAGVTVDTYEDIPGDELSSSADASAAGRTLEVGSMVWHSIQEVPAGWLRIKRDPQALTKSQYPELNAKYAAQGYPYGSTSTTFNIPGGAGLFPRIWDDTSTLDPDSASRTDHATGLSVVGNVIGSRQANDVKQHSHAKGSLAVSIGNAGGHTHEFATRSQGSGGSHTGLPVPPMSDSGSSGGSDGTTKSEPAHSHSATVSGSTADIGGAETRPDNIAYPFIILVNPSEAAASHATLGMPYKFGVDVTEDDPGSGYVRFNDAVLSNATEMYVSVADVFGSDVSDVWQTINSIAGTRRAVISVYNVGALVNSTIAMASGDVVDNGSFLTVPIEIKSANGTLAADARLSVQIAFSGDPGVAGAAGPNTGLDYRWDSGTSDADPGNGDLRLNNATLASATFLYISKTGRNAEALGTLIDGWDASNNASHKGYLRILALANRANFIEATVSGALTDGGNYWKVPITVVSSGGSFTNAETVSVVFARTGDSPGAPVITTFASSGTYTKTTGARMAHVRGCGGGGSGGGVSGVASQTAAAAGGGAGGEFDFWLDVTGISSETVTIGAGGAAPAAGANNGNAGGTTSFGAHATANGGAGGLAMAAGTALAVVAPAAGGTTSGLGGANGQPSNGGIRLSGTVAVSGSGGSGRFGGGGAGISVAGAGPDATGYGSGGAGAMSSAATARAGGAGTPGYIIVEEYF